LKGPGGKDAPWIPWVQQAREGDEQAFAALYRTFRPGLHHAIHHLLSDSDLTAEVVSHAFVKAWEHLPELEHAPAFPGWLRRVAINRVRDLWRRQRHESPLPDDDDPAALADPTPLAEEHLAALADQAALQAALRALPPPFREVVVLHHLEELPVAEVAELLELPRGTVLSRLARARARLLKSLLSPQENRS